MVFRDRKGQIGFTGVILGFLILFIVVVVGVAMFNNTSGSSSSFGDALGDSFLTVSNGFMGVLGPTFNLILGLDRPGIDANNQFLMVLTFILISIIIVGTLDSVNIFGGQKQSNLINLAVGIIISIIGVRFMPTDIWGALTAPSSAFVATILVGIPFAGIFFATMIFKAHLIRKGIWLFYVIFMPYLIFFPQTGFSLSNSFMWIYLTFLLLGGVMLFFDSTVRHYFYKEKHKLEIQDMIGNMNAQERYYIRRQIEKWQNILADSTAKSDWPMAKTQITILTKKYGDLFQI